MIPKEAAVEKRAHELWVEAGRPEGNGQAEAFWYKAEEELESREYGNDHPQPVSPLPETDSGSKPVMNG
ncbi:Protein of unknown function [Verrucomicrobium sp. GAS474]|uniref:DUF2934 domain-containing protein n=1 Tax=Verrucomicrobium sp. GAS474 TaxID=1882831 RepID=UPI00087DE34D|nr:DUF2934 domain-containing protein [Verrucomicrobium sp. GAS474]SDU30201.1 Protein of unknown function [Verrucomicrobium sp. GAS474]